MLAVLDELFKDENGIKLQEQLQSATDHYLRAVEQPGVSPLKAFQDAAMPSSFAQEIDTLYASDGGLIYYVTNKLFSALTYQKMLDTCMSARFSPLSRALVADIRQAKSLRKMQEIKKVMMTSNLEDKVGSLATDTRQLTDAGGQGLEAEAEAEAGQCRAREEVKEGGIAEGMAAMSVGEVVVNKEFDLPQSG